ncbi:helix-turn-helix domain-containing protein [Microlunatus soli]|uniref:Regulatory protein, luxR family n=1 Tax=Microlunatus soli TaxID=630515 RepID=A0A1H1VZ50_9ACTN|nr:hypothetical protein [Microlunatus soli]SDS89720.1 hypothetical protein SAMN04489812_3407 [Microlunatus soli]
MLEIFGIDEESEKVYARLLALGSAPIEKVAEEADASPEVVEGRIATLQSAGLCVRDVTGWWQVVPLPEALRALRAKRTAELDALVASADATQTRLLAMSDVGSGNLRALVGGEALRTALRDFAHNARFEICGFDKPPYEITRPPTKEWLEEHSPEYQALLRGVGIRSVYHPGFDRNRLTEMSTFHDAGERARTGDVPMKLMIADASVALTQAPASYAPDQERRAILVQHPIMVEALQSLFEAIWHRSLPIDTTSGGLSSDPRRDLLISLLMGGATDVAIANQLGVTERSVRRWIANLMEDLDVQTRLQLGAALARSEALRNDSTSLAGLDAD